METYVKYTGVIPLVEKREEVASIVYQAAGMDTARIIKPAEVLRVVALRYSLDGAEPSMRLETLAGEAREVPLSLHDGFFDVMEESYTSEESKTGAVELKEFPNDY